MRKFGLVALIVLLGTGQAHAHPADSIARGFFPGACEPTYRSPRLGENVPSPLPVAWARSPRLIEGWPCEIVTTPAFRKLSAASQCYVIVHEYGHLAGNWHTQDKGSVMWSDVAPFTHTGERVRGAAVQRACEGRKHHHRIERGSVHADLFLASRATQRVGRCKKLRKPATAVRALRNRHHGRRAVDARWKLCV